MNVQITCLPWRTTTVPALTLGSVAPNPGQVLWAANMRTAAPTPVQAVRTLIRPIYDLRSTHAACDAMQDKLAPCPLTSRLRHWLHRLPQQIAGRDLCRCQNRNGGHPVRLQLIDSNGRVAHVRSRWVSWTIIFVVLRRNGGWQVDDTFCAGRPDTSLYRYQGSAFPCGIAPQASSPPSPTRSLNGITCVSVSVCYAVGTAGTILATTNGGRRWTSLSNPIRGYRFIDLDGITCPSPAVCYAVGGHGTMLKTLDSGKTWLMQKTPLTVTRKGLFRVACPSATICHALGRDTVLRSRDGGRTWHRELAAPRDSRLTDIACPGPEACDVVGYAGFVATTPNGGASWHGQSIAVAGETAPLLAIACPSATVCYVVGDAGSVLKTMDGGRSWTARTLGRGVTLLGIACPNTRECYAVAVGQRGKILKTVNGGRSWMSIGVRPPVDRTDPLAIACPASRICFAVGFAGAQSSYAILVTRDGGRSWTSQIP